MPCEKTAFCKSSGSLNKMAVWKFSLREKKQTDCSTETEHNGAMQVASNSVDLERAKPGRRRKCRYRGAAVKRRSPALLRRWICLQSTFFICTTSSFILRVPRRLFPRHPWRSLFLPSAPVQFLWSRPKVALCSVVQNPFSSRPNRLHIHT